MPFFETSLGPARKAAGRVLVPVARTLRLRVPVPGLAVGLLVWSRPVGVEVHEAGERRFLKVADRARKVQCLLLGAGLVIGFLIRRRRRAPRNFLRR